MNESQDLYPTLVENSKKAFAGRLFTASYHILSAALCCAAELQDHSKLREIEDLAQSQYEQLRASLDGSGPSKDPVELSLYASLVQIVRTRLLLGSKSK